MVKDRLRSGALRVGAALALLWLLPGCFTFQAVSPGEVTPGEEVQLVLAGSASRSMAPSALMGESYVQGNLVGVTEDSVAVSVWIGEAYRGTPFEPVHQTYAFPRGDLVRIERRQLSRARTALTAVGAVVGIYAMIQGVEFLDNPNPGPGDGLPDPPTEQPFAATLFRFFIGR